MRIAFDLDDTLIPGRVSFALEPLPRNPLRRWLCMEPIRAGSVSLLRDLRQAQHEVWIYTTSYRSPLQTRIMFYAYGVQIHRVVNQYEHERIVSHQLSGWPHCSKFPPAFGIDLLVDECAGVAAEARRYHFDVVQVDPVSDNWDHLVRQRVLGFVSKRIM